MRTAFSLALCVVLVGCSGASSSDLFATAGDDSTSPSAASTNTPAASSTAPASSSSSSDGASGSSGNSGNGNSGSGSGSGNSGDSSDAGSSGKDAGSSNAACTTGETEVEPNDTFANANVMSDSKFCGEINPQTDVDFATFTLSATAKNVSVDYTATDKISIQVTTKGTTVEITGTNPPPIPANPGDKYTIEVKGVSGSMPAYAITVTQ